MHFGTDMNALDFGVKSPKFKAMVFVIVLFLSLFCRSLLCFLFFLWARNNICVCICINYDGNRTLRVEAYST